MGKKRKKMTAEERAAFEERSERTLRMLQERIDYYEAKLKGKEQSA
jgi:hypothetical protein